MTDGSTLLPAETTVVEVGLRDGLQSVPDPVLATAEKVELITALIEAGVKHIEAVSFAHPRVLPQLADAEAVMAAVPRPEGVVYRGLIPNARAAERAADCGLDEFVAVISADDEVSRRNQNRGVDELLAELGVIARTAESADAALVVGIACAFFAPARGAVPWAETARVLERAVAEGAAGVYLACTTGMESPREVAAGVARVRAAHPSLRVGVHLHNRNGFAPAVAMAALASGADWLESAMGGLGGDLWFPGDPSVLGNFPTEDLVALLDSLGVRSGIDLDGCLRVVRRAAELTRVEPRSFVWRGGTRAGLAGARWPDPGQDRGAAPGSTT